MTDLEIDVLVEAGSWQGEDELGALASQMIQMAAKQADSNILSGSEISLVFTDDAHIKQLNADHREKDKPTNVLSFPQCPPDSETFGPLLGDIVIAQETVAREAEELGITFDHHLRHLIVHGFLHLLGYDHIEDDEAEEMETLEVEILSQFDIQNPYEKEGFQVRPSQDIS